jgi:hypothetical protein
MSRSSPTPAISQTDNQTFSRCEADPFAGLLRSSHQQQRIEMMPGMAIDWFR